MKILIIIFIFVIGFGAFFYANSNAILGPAAPLSDPSLPEVLVQIQVRNSDGVLVAYIEPTVCYHSNVYLIHKRLNGLEAKTTFMIDGKSYEQFELEMNHVDRYRGQRASYSLWQDGFGVLNCRYDGFIGEVGDLQTVSWRITRTI